MKKTLYFTIAGAIVMGGISFAAPNDWGSDTTTKSLEVKNTNLSASQKEETSVEEEAEGNNASYAIAFYINGQPFRVDLLENSFSKPIPVQDEQAVELIEMEKYFTTSLMPKNVFKALPISDNMIFYSGLQSNADFSQWVYIERNMDNMDFNVRMFNMSTKEDKVLFGQANSPNKKYAFKPFAFSKDNSKVYLEALVFGSSTEHEGIWVMDLNTQEINELNVHEYYVSTPTVSPDGKYLLYTAALQRNDVHVPANQLFIYDIDKKKEIQIMSDKKAFVSIKGWMKTK